MELERTNEIAVLRMRAGKANAIGDAFLRRLTPLIEELRASDAKAAVLTGDGRFFSAGLALPELVRLERGAMHETMNRFESVMEMLWSLSIPLVAAIDGHAIAGGCVLALQCDRRLMAEDAGVIGLSEVALGIGLPASVVESLRANVPASSLAPIALEGTLLPPRVAQTLGLVDEVLPREKLEHRAIELARALGENGPAYGQIKAALRAPALERMRSQRADELEKWLDTWFSPLGRERVGAAVAKLAAK